MTNTLLDLGQGSHWMIYGPWRQTLPPAIHLHGKIQTRIFFLYLANTIQTTQIMLSYSELWIVSVYLEICYLSELVSFTPLAKIPGASFILKRKFPPVCTRFYLPCAKNPILAVWIIYLWPLSNISVNKIKFMVRVWGIIKKKQKTIFKWPKRDVTKWPSAVPRKLLHVS